MRYNGGKSRACKRIATAINSFDPNLYIEPFVGAAWVTQHVDAQTKLAYDANKYLIAMWNALQNGWIPPDNVTREDHKKAKNAKNGEIEDHLRAFIRFGCSFGGDWFGGFALPDRRYKDQKKASSCYVSKKGLMKKLPNLMDVQFTCADYRTLKPSGAIIYCDPPYNQTYEGWGGPKFDHDEFWVIMKKWSKDNTIIISGWSSPEGVPVLCDWPDIKVVTGSHPKDPDKRARTEKLFILKKGE